VCHRDSWLSGVFVSQIVLQHQVDEMKEYLGFQLERNQQLQNSSRNLQIIEPKCVNGTVVAFSHFKGKKAPIAVAGVDLSIGQLKDEVVLSEYIEKFQKQLL
jgi:hypothetical protein